MMSMVVETKKVVNLRIKIYPDYRACTGYDVRLTSAVVKSLKEQYITQLSI